MIDGALPTMIDEVLIKPGKMSAYAVAPRPVKTPFSKHAGPFRGCLAVQTPLSGNSL